MAPVPSTVNVTAPAGGVRRATGPPSVTVTVHVAATPGETPFGPPAIDSFVGFAAALAPPQNASAAPKATAPMKIALPTAFSSRLPTAVPVLVGDTVAQYAARRHPWNR